MSQRRLLAGGDIEITVLTSMASVWNLGIADPDGPCGDGTLDLSEDCDDGNKAGGDCCSATCSLEASGSACVDGDLCTTDDACDGAGACDAGSTTVVCAAQSSCHDAGVCIPATGLCSNPPKGAGAACGSGADDACTDPDTCDGAGNCSAHDVGACCLLDVGCDDGNACTSDACNSNACAHVAIAGCCMAASACDDANACTTDSCASNACAHVAIAGCGSQPDKDAAIDADPDAGRQPDGGVPATSDAGGDAQVTDKGDAGSPVVGEDTGCQCRVGHQSRPIPLALVAFGVFAATRLGRRRKR